MPVESRPIAERAWSAMGCEVSVVIVGDRPDLLDVAVARVEDLESRWSRFRPDSEISELNRRAGAPLKVTSDTRLLVETSLEAWWATGGLFDPMVGAAVIAAGYDRTIAAVQSRAGIEPGPSRPSPGCEGIEIDGSAGEVALPAHSRFDPGGLGKGLAADVIAIELLAAGALGACVDLGGDVRVAGLGPFVEDGVELGWNIGIADPLAPERDAAVASVAGGAVATSSTLKRRWRTVHHDGANPGSVRHDVAHHLIDPRTGRPSSSSIVAATVIAANGSTAEVLATAAIVGGVVAATSMIDELGAAAVLVEADGTRTIVGPFEAFLVEPLPLAHSPGTSARLWERVP